MEVAKVMVVEDNDLMRDSMAQTLARAGFEVVSFPDGKRAVEGFSSECVHLVITDYKMPEMNGLELLAEIGRIAPDVPVIMITAFGTIEHAVKAVKLGAYDYIEKPFKADSLEMIVRRALEHRDLSTENEYLRARIGETGRHEIVYGNSPAMTAAMETIKQVAQSDSTALIFGESGCGKELAAVAIHSMSRRSDKPFLCVNCAALSAGLLESELFGHEKGAFTGADRMRKGRFELADSGTLLLDEVSEIDLNLQAKLLRVLQEKTFERVGSSQSRRVDVRVIATTNRELGKYAAEGRFRKDLYYRLNVVPIVIPPLRERRDDIPLLIEYYRKFFKIGDPFSPKLMKAFLAYDWRGNVRELANIMERISVLSKGGRVPENLCISWLQGESQDSPESYDALAGIPLDEIERQLIRVNMKRCGGNQQRTADTLGISSRTLREKLKKMANISS